MAATFALAAPPVDNEIAGEELADDARSGTGKAPVSCGLDPMTFGNATDVSVVFLASTGRLFIYSLT